MTNYSRWTKNELIEALEQADKEREAEARRHAETIKQLSAARKRIEALENEIEGSKFGPKFTVSEGFAQMIRVPGDTTQPATFYSSREADLERKLVAKEQEIETVRKAAEEMEEQANTAEAQLLQAKADMAGINHELIDSIEQRSKTLAQMGQLEQELEDARKVLAYGLSQSPVWRGRMDVPNDYEAPCVHLLKGCDHIIAVVEKS